MQTTPARPRFRTDLVAEPIEEGGHRYIDVVDPDNGNGFRFYDVEYSLACAMDGERDVAGLVVWAKEELGIEPSASELAQVINTLDDLGYLASGVAMETELAPGVVGQPQYGRRPGEAGEDVELGYGGGQPGAPEAPLPRSDFELGLAGPQGERPTAPYGAAAGGPELGAAGGPREIVMEFEAPTPPPPDMPSFGIQASLRPTTRPDAEDDGPTNLPPAATAADFDDDEVSVDLSDHLAISASDVKEAVRASKVMKAVDLPPELQAQLESQERDMERAREAAERMVAERAEREAAAEREIARAAAERAAAEAARPAVELPKQPPVGVSRPRPATDRPVAKAPVVAKEPAPQPRGNGLLLVLLLLLIAAAGLAVYWYVIEKHPLPWEKQADDTTGATGATGGSAVATGPATAGTAEQPQPPQPPPPPPPPSATLTENAGAAADVVAGQAGYVTFIADDGATVAEGDALVKFQGKPEWESKLQGLDYDIDIRVPKQIADATAKRDAAQAAGRAAAVKAAQATIDERTKRLAEKNAERDKIRAAQEALTLKSPAAGTVAIKVAKLTRTKADQVVATVTPAPLLQAMFTVPGGRSLPTANASVRVAVKATPDQKANCTVIGIAGAQVTVTCPADSGIAAGTEVILE